MDDLMDCEDAYIDLRMTSLCYYCVKGNINKCGTNLHIVHFQDASHQWIAKCPNFESKYEEVRYGHWICDLPKPYSKHVRKCSVCGSTQAHGLLNRCPECGAIMREGAKMDKRDGE